MARLLIIVLVVLVSFSSASALDESLILYLPLDRGTGKIVEDASIHKNDGEIFGNARRVDGKIGRGLEFVPGSHIEIPNIPAYDVSGEMSLMAWINTSSVQNLARIIDKSEVDVGGFALIIHNSNFIPRFTSPTVGAVAFAEASTPVDDGEWYFVAATFGKDKDKAGKETGFRALKIYVDGVLEGDSISASKIIPNDWPITLGSQTSTKEQQYTGMIDEVAIFNRELSEDEILDIYENGFISVDSRGKLAVLWGDLRK